ncbi:hypothetical protein ACPWSR_12575 [Alloiococcus sp. CFN-8]|uniref:hypothetical protein n=1 Tax=Alloiococcus sp. CFN-8 TaxID=3416081 RepID=UPI003CF902D8
MKRSIKIVFAAILFLLLVPSMSVFADIGPKPSVVIEFHGLEKEEYYVTLLSESTTTGPWSVGEDYNEYMGDEAVFQKFSQYEDADGYHFLGYMENCSEDDIFEWTYFPPSPFKVLIYFPEYDSFLMDENVFERYAFDSYFTAEVTGIENIAVSRDAEAVTINIMESYDFSLELVSFSARVLITVALEILIALIFMYRDKKALVIITLTNVLTQVILNIFLNVINNVLINSVNYEISQYALIAAYVLIEAVIFVIEAVIYSKFVGRENVLTKVKHHPFWYSAVANTASFLLGLWISNIVPGIF